MFEVVLSLCLAAGGGPCREVLLPGYEAADRTGCQAALDLHPPMHLPGGHATGVPDCRPAAPPALAFAELAPGVFVHRGQIAEPDRGNAGDTSNFGFVIGTRSVAVIDSGTARWMGEAIWRAIRARTDLPVSHVILTHMHPDHVFGASVFAEVGARVIGHAALNRALADRQENYRESLSSLIGERQFIGTETVAVDIGVEDRARIDLGGRTIELRAWPPAHTGTDLTAFEVQSGLLFTGDLLFDDHIPALDGSALGWQAVLAEMKTLPVTRVVPGHGGPLLDWPEGAAAQERYLDRLVDDTRAALDQGQRLGEAIGVIAGSEAAHWALFDAFNARNATVAYTELEWE